MAAYMPIHRLVERTATALPPDRRAVWGKIAKSVLADISPHGCRITGPDLALAPGDHVIIRTASLLGAAGTVRWAEGGNVGVEFDQALGRAVMDHFLRNAAAGVTLIVPVDLPAAM